MFSEKSFGILFLIIRHFVANFRGVKGISKLADRKKFLIYSAYAWGSSLFMISLCLFMDGSSFISNDWKPGFGDKNCFLKSIWSSEFVLTDSITIVQYFCRTKDNGIFVSLFADHNYHMLQFDIFHIDRIENTQGSNGNVENYGKRG